MDYHPRFEIGTYQLLARYLGERSPQTIRIVKIGPAPVRPGIVCVILPGWSGRSRGQLPLLSGERLGIVAQQASVACDARSDPENAQACP